MTRYELESKLTLARERLAKIEGDYDELKRAVVAVQPDVEARVLALSRQLTDQGMTPEIRSEMFKWGRLLIVSEPSADVSLPLSARMRAYDPDELTITLAFDTEEEMQAVLVRVPPGNPAAGSAPSPQKE